MGWRKRIAQIHIETKHQVLCNAHILGEVYNGREQWVTGTADRVPRHRWWSRSARSCTAGRGGIRPGSFPSAEEKPLSLSGINYSGSLFTIINYSGYFYIMNNSGSFELFEMNNNWIFPIKGLLCLSVKPKQKKSPLFESFGGVLCQKKGRCLNEKACTPRGGDRGGQTRSAGKTR